MGIPLSSYKLLYSILSALATVFGYAVSYFVNFEKIKDLAEMFIGSLMISISIVFMTIDSQAYCTETYPFSYLISLITFILLTFYTFIKDSVALLDDTLLFRCDNANSIQIPSPEELLPTEEENPKFSLVNNFVSILLFLITCTEGIAFSCVIGCFKTVEDINGRLPFIIPIRFFQMFCISTYLREMNIKWVAYFVLCLINALCDLPFGLLDQFVSDKATDLFFAVCTSLLLGYFLYFGATAIHNSRMSFTHSSWISIICSFFGFIIPIIFRTLMKDPSK